MRIRDEAPTLVLLVGCYGVFGVVIGWSALIGVVPSIVILSIVITLHSSLQHEILHGHPFQSDKLNGLLVFPALGLFVPYLRFRDLHLAHHFDPNLTDPYEDPESNFFDPEDWRRLPAVSRVLWTFNNTLLGRMLLGPALSLLDLYWADLRTISRGHRKLMLPYALHLLGVVPVVLLLVYASALPVWAYIVAAYLGMSILKIRTFLEHRAHDRAAARSVIIEDRGFLALLFLNNNYHAVHHAHPKVAWHKLPALFAARRVEFLRRNGGYVYRSYWQVILPYLLVRKDPLAHPLLQNSDVETSSATPAVQGEVIEHLQTSAM